MIEPLPMVKVLEMLVIPRDDSAIDISFERVQCEFSFTLDESDIRTFIVLLQASLSVPDQQIMCMKGILCESIHFKPD